MRLVRVLIAWAAGMALVAPSGRVSADGEAAPGGTDVHLTTDGAIRPGRNALWCATGQLAWDALADAVGPIAGTPGRIELRPPAPPAVVAALNRRAFPHGDLDATSTVVVGGLVRDGVVDRIARAFRDRFPHEAPPAIDAGPQDAVGFAALRKDLPFETPFRKLETKFGGAPTRYRAFGMMHDDHAPDVEAMASQVTVWFDGETREAYESGWRPVVELTPRGGDDRILLSALDPAETLEATWQRTAARLAKGRSQRLDSDEDLAIPRVRLDVAREFGELAGAPILGIDGSRVKEVRQAVRFSLTEKGAKVESDALMLMSLGIGLRLRFEGPFLLALMRRGATRPYLLLWVGNDALLEKAVPPRPATAAEVAPYRGSWTLDLERTIDEGADRLIGLDEEPMEDPDAPGKPCPPEKRKALEVAALREQLKGATLAMDVSEAGDVESRIAMDVLREDERPDGAIVWTGRLVVQDDAVHLRVEGADGKPVPEEEAVVIRVRVADGRLRFPIPGLIPVVLRRP